MYNVGLDAGSTSTKAVLLQNGQIKAWVIRPTGWSPRETAQEVYYELLDNAGIEEASVKSVTATGYGRVNLDFATKTLTEITCHALGAYHYFPLNDVVIDIGGQDSKVIQVSPQGAVSKFAMNDKCAAGTGRFLQVMSTALGMDISEMAMITSNEPANITSMCTVFAESEVISLLASGTAKDSIAAGLYHAIARRIASMATGFRLNNITFTGGGAKNSALKIALEKALKISLDVPPEPQIIGALGAALSEQRDRR